MLRTFAGIFVGKTIFFLSRILKLGGGYAAPGLYALKINSNLVGDLINHHAKNIVITGTNGKTTTSKLIAHYLKGSNVKVLRNSSGSNLERGIASYLIQHSNFSIAKYDIGIWELDEFAFNSVTPKIKPDLIILLNAFRDQLDRYGEVDKVIRLWQESLAGLSKETLLIVNQDDGNLLKAARDFKGKIVTFGLKDSKISGESKSGISKKPDYEATLRLHLKGVKLNNLENTHFEVSFNGDLKDFALPLPGIFNVYNFLASFATAHLLNLDTQKIAQSLPDFKPAFGRFEKFEVGGKPGHIFLIKNPVGATQVLQTILPHLNQDDTLLIALNDNFADGTDVSWIWDIGLEEFKIQSSKFKVFVSGIRAYDLALRLKYAGVKNLEIETDLSQAFDKATSQTRGKLFVLPTYTAMLKIQKILVKKGVKKEYWRE